MLVCAKTFGIIIALAICAIPATAGPFPAKNDYAPARTASPTGVIATSITIGLIDPNAKVPAVDVVPGAGIDTISTAIPLTLLSHTTQYAITLATQNTDYKGTCTDAYQFTQVQKGKTVVLQSHTINTFKCGKEIPFIFSWYTATFPKAYGWATLTGTVSFGGQVSSISIPVKIE
jgi:hypothetical protein